MSVSKVKFAALRKHAHLTGLRPKEGIRNLKAAGEFFSGLRQFSEMNTNLVFRPRWDELYPILTDFTDEAGVAGGHYFHQDLWAARRIFQRHPKAHIDVGSRVDGFIAHLLVFMPVTVVDIRPLTSLVSGLTFVRDDATKLQRFGDNTVDPPFEPPRGGALRAGSIFRSDRPRRLLHLHVRLGTCPGSGGNSLFLGANRS